MCLYFLHNMTKGFNENKTYVLYNLLHLKEVVRVDVIELLRLSSAGAHRAPRNARAHARPVLRLLHHMQHATVSVRRPPSPVTRRRPVDGGRGTGDRRYLR